MIIVAKTISIRSEDSDFQYRKGARGGNQRFWKNGYHHTYYFGHDYAVKPTKIIVVVEINGQTFDVFIDHFFRANIGRMTASRVNRIKAALPETLTVEEVTSYNGNTYYRIFEDQIMDEWLANVQVA